jgi:hypothetical protein
MSICCDNILSDNRIGRSLYSHLAVFSWEQFPSTDSFESCESPKMMVIPIDLSKFELTNTKTINQIGPDKTIVKKSYRIFSSSSRFGRSKIDITCCGVI